MVNLYLLFGAVEAGFVDLWIIAYAVMLFWGQRRRDWGTSTTGRYVQDGVDDGSAQALRAEGFDPDDPAVVRWELSLGA
jgi:hypothetical protein